MGLLNLPSLKATSMEEGDMDYKISAVIKSKDIRSCLHCNTSGLSGHGSKVQLFMDTPMHGKQVGILLSRRRLRCGNCRKTQFEQSDDLSEDHRATTRLVEYIQKRALRYTNSSVAQDVGVTEATVRNVLKGLKNDRFLMLKRRSSLTDQQKFILEGWTLNFPLLAKAYEAKEAFYEIYTAQPEPQQN